MTIITCEECLHKVVCPNCNDFDDVLNVKDYCEHFIEKSALEKQIPKKPNIETIKSDVDIASGEYETETNYTCPVCGEVVGDYDKDVFYGRFCCACSQALDWGDSE